MGVRICAIDGDEVQHESETLVGAATVPTGGFVRLLVAREVVTVSAHHPVNVSTVDEYGPWVGPTSAGLCRAGADTTSAIGHGTAGQHPRNRLPADRRTSGARPPFQS